MIDDLVAASRILANEGVLDCFGHVSVRSPNNPARYLLSCNLAPELVTTGDIMEFEVESSNPVEPRDRPVFLERFIHGAIYKGSTRCQCDSAQSFPFSIVSSVPMRPAYHMSGFLYTGVPIYEIRHDAGMSDMLIRSVELGSALARVLGDKSVALLRGHGNVVVGPTIPIAVYRAIYTEINSRLQMQAITLGGRVQYLDPAEGRKIDAVVPTQVSRPWELWKKKVTGK